MDGDLVDLPQLLKIRNQYPNTLLMLDESHSFGTIGSTGRGLEEHYEIAPNAGPDLIMVSLSKAIPGNGGVVAGKKDIIRFLRYQAHPIMFSSSLPTACIGTTKAAIELLAQDNGKLVKKLRNNVTFLRESLRSNGISCEDHLSPITGVMIYSEELAFKISQECFEQGLYLLPVGFPAVARGKERLRITVTVDHTEDDIVMGCKILGNVLSKTKNL
ncbi:MAG: pyridoxal phosphate-dependent aminotransferase family protein [Alphaproteobacteria bacterium]